MRHGGPRSIVVLGALLGVPVGGAVAQETTSPYGPVDESSEAMRRIRAAMHHRPDGSHHLLLTSLRQLRAESLRPLFRQLVQADHWTLQLDGILGLAELDQTPVDPALIERIAAPAERAAAIRAAIALDLVGVAEAEEMLRWTAVPPAEQVALLGELHARGVAISPESMAALAGSEDLRVAAKAAVLLAELGDSAAVDLFASRVDRVTGAAREDAVVTFARTAEKHLADTAVPTLVRFASASSATRSERLACLSALLAADLEVGLELWVELFEATTSNAGRLRTALLLLASEQPLPPEALAHLDGHGEVLEALGAAATAVATGTDRVEAFRRLLAGGHRLSVAWAMTALIGQPPEVAVPIYVAMLESLIEGRPTAPMMAIEAAARLSGLDPDALAPLLEAAAERDEALLEALLVGILSGTDREAAARLARGVLGLGGRRCDSLAVLAIARSPEPLSPSEADLLAIAAAGGGRLDPSLEVQAAWLHLERLDRIPDALASAAGDP